MQQLLEQVTVHGDRLYLYSQVTHRFFVLTAREEADGRLTVDVVSKRALADRKRQVWEDLSRREREVISLVLEGKSYRAISESLFISVGTVKKTAYNAYRKIGVGSRWELVHGKI